MKHFIDFINAKNLANNATAKILKCNTNELKILQFMAKALLEEKNNLLVLNILEAVFNAKGAQLTRYLKHIKTLLDLDYIYLSNASSANGTNIVLLELLNSYVCLSQTFLETLEGEKRSYIPPKIKPYESDMDYLKDEFFRIKYLRNLAEMCATYIDHRDSKFMQKELDNISNIIAKRLAITKKKLIVLSILQRFGLNSEESIIFFALLRVEYYGESSYYRSTDELMKLIIDDDCKLNVIESLNKLTEKGLFGYDENFSGKEFFIKDAILKSIMRSQKSIKTSLGNYIENKQNIFEIIHPKTQLNDVVLPLKTREIIDMLIKQLDISVAELLKKWEIKNNSNGIDAKIIFYGPPGTGKTLTAYALSNALNMPLLVLDCSKILSKWVGDSEKNVRNIFDTYNKIKNELNSDAILFLDEADQFLSQRGEVVRSVDKMYNQMQNIFLAQIENFDGILIATTNLLENIDKAFSRRFNYKIEFSKPDIFARKKIWEITLPKNASYEKRFSIDKLSRYELTGGQIKIIVKNTAYKVATRKPPIFKESDFLQEIENEIHSSFDSGKNLGFI